MQITVLLALTAELFDPVPVEEMRGAEPDSARKALDAFPAAPDTKPREKP